MDIREMRTRLGDTQSAFAARYNIPFRTVQNWETGLRRPPEYMLELLNKRVAEDLVNRKTVVLPEFDPKKQSLPKMREFQTSLAWLRAVRDRMGEEVVFALDEALMCHGRFLGRDDEYLVWVYGSDALSQFNGVVVLGNHISPYSVRNRDGLLYTDFSRTVSDALANEAILDMQGITEAISHYYYTHNESVEGICVAPEYQDRFEMLVRDAVEYYDD